MTTPALHASRENIKRAQRKFDDLKATINGFYQSAPYSLRIERELDRTHIISCRNHDLSEDVAFDVVEVVQRLRAALDKAMVTIVERNGRGTSGVGFPFGGIDRNTGQPNPFPDPRMEAGLKKKLTADQWDFIAAQRPYPGGNDTLWSINEIANEDKHRPDLVTVAPRLGHGFALRGGADGVTRIDFLAIRPSDCNHLLRDQEREEVLMSLGPVVSQHQAEHEFSIGVVFGNVGPVAGKEILVTLNQHIRMTDQIIKDFASLLERTHSA